VNAGLVVERDGPVTTLRLDRPDRLNALDYALVRELYAALGALHADLSQRVVVLTGTGRAFCSGIDLKEQAAGAAWDPSVGHVQERYALQQAVSGLVSALRRIPQPVVAMVGGVAAGGGLSLACAADLRVAEPTASFSAAFVKLGASGGDLGSTYFLPRIIGWERAAEILYTGRTVDAAEAERIGLVGRVVPAGEGLATAHALAAEIATTAPMSVRMTKSLLDLSRDGASLDQVLEFENRTQVLLTGTADFAEGVRAVGERRLPTFTDH
jgi:enoyl-CoA hydratase